MSSVASLGSEKYVSFTTFRKNGERKSLPVWIAEMDNGSLAFTTSSGSWKVKRLAVDPRIELQPCDQRGNVRSGTTVTTGTAVMVQDPSLFGEARAKIDAKYKVMAKAIQLMSKIASKVGKGDAASDCAIIVTLDQA